MARFQFSTFLQAYSHEQSGSALAAK